LFRSALFCFDVGTLRYVACFIVCAQWDDSDTRRKGAGDREAIFDQGKKVSFDDYKDSG